MDSKFTVTILIKMPKISLQKRRQVINLYKQKWNICRISKELSIISSTVLRIIKKYQTFGTVEDRKRPGRNRKITEKMKKIVVWTAKEQRKNYRSNKKQSGCQLLYSNSERSCPKLFGFARNFPTRQRPSPQCRKNANFFRGKCLRLSRKLASTVTRSEYY